MSRAFERLLSSGLAAILVLSLGILTSCSREPDTRIIVAGSTSVQPYAEVLAEAYHEKHPHTLIDIQGGGSSAGIIAVQNHTAQIGMSSRLLKEDEQGLVVIEIAKDGLAIIVHPDNPVFDLSLIELRGIYSQSITSWSQVGGNDAQIHIIAREDGSGTRAAFEEQVMGEAKISPRAIIQDSNGAVHQIVSNDLNAIGFISLGLLNIGEQPVKALSLDGVAPTNDSVIIGSYNLARPFLFLIEGEPEGAILDFIDFVLSHEGRRILRIEGLVVG